MIYICKLLFSLSPCKTQGTCPQTGRTPPTGWRIQRSVHNHSYSFCFQKLRKKADGLEENR